MTCSTPRRPTDTMKATVRLVLFASILALGCARSTQTAEDSANAASHDSSMHGAHMGGAVGDSAFAGVQARGAVGMGVDQYTSVHTFESRPDGGRITFR